MKGELDLTKCGAAVREEYFDNLIVSVEVGVWETDIDVVMDELSPNFRERMGWRARWSRRKHRKKTPSAISEMIPIGFNLALTPKGAVLTLYK